MGRALWEVLEGVPDRREASGRRFPLPAILAIAIAAMLAGRTSLAAIARWGRQLDREALRALGITRPRAPCHSTYHYVFCDLDVDALEAGLAAWVRSAAAAVALNHVALDGKRLRGSRTAEGPGVHLLAAFCRSLQGVIGELRVPPGGNEITAALTLLKGLSLEGLLVTGDAEFAQHEICRAIVERGGDDFFVVKDNQPRLRADIALLFAPPPEGGGGASPRGARCRPRRRVGQGPRPDRVAPAGGQRGARRLPRLAGRGAGLPDRAAAPDPGRGGRRDGPCDHQPAPRAGRRRPAPGAVAGALGHREPAALGARDVTLGEDACRVRTGAAPQVLAACRNAVLTLVRRLGLGVVEGIEHFQEHRRAALALVRFGRIE